MSGGMPELGSKISLISKADIRYEGRLYTVDPQECTIALSSVRSFGTEDRETQFQIAPQSQIYDYILFRGSDIKDIRVVNNSLPHPNDPAIMQVQLPNGQHIMPHFSMPNMNPHPPAPPMSTGAYGPFGAMGGLSGMSATGSSAATSLAPGAGGGGAPVAPGTFILNNQQHHQQQQQQQPQQNKQQQQKQPTQVDSNSISNQLSQTLSVGNGAGVVGVGGAVVGLGSTAPAVPNNLLSKANLANAALLDHNKEPVSVVDLLAGASRSTTPISLISRKSPAEMGVQVTHPQQLQQHHQNSINQHQSHQNNGGGGGNVRDAGHKRQNHHQQRGPNNNNQRNNTNSNNDYYNQRDRRDSSGRNMDNFNNQHHEIRAGGGGNNFNNQRNHPGQSRAWTMHRGQNNAGGGGSGNNMMRNRGGGGRGRMSNQGYRPMGGVPGGNQNKPRNPKNTIKFEQDYDFEQANHQFEELRSQLTKLKVGDEPKSTEQINGEAGDKKDDSGNETGAGEHEPEDEEITVGYDKTKSFFDNISCEAAQDRSKNKKNDWRQERKLNSETFGVSSTRRGGRHFFANNYRGRGNYYNRNMGNYNVGGYNRSYRLGNNYNRNRNQRMGAGNHSNQINSAPTTNGSGTAGQGSNPTTDPTTLKKQQQNVSASTNTTTTAEAGGTVTTTTVISNIKTSTASTTQENNTHSQLVGPIAAGQ